MKKVKGAVKKPGHTRYAGAYRAQQISPRRWGLIEPDGNFSVHRSHATSGSKYQGIVSYNNKKDVETLAAALNEHHGLPRWTKPRK